MQKKKEKIKIQGKNYKVEKPVSQTLKALADALHSHEVALMTWVHKDYIGKGLKAKDKKEFRESLNNYCMQIPQAENILKRMSDIDKQMDKEIKEQNKNEKKDGEAKE
tara:strand:+ start:1425 stop:1748 length:324 start_codon:yes stop_codon:yes gene_type:complete